MDERDLLRRIMRIAVRNTSPTSERAAEILSWCNKTGVFASVNEPEEEDRRKRQKKKKPKCGANPTRTQPWDRLCATLAKPRERSEETPEIPLQIAERVAALLALTPPDARLLAVAVGLVRLPRASTLTGLLCSNGIDEVALAAELAGLNGADAIARSAVVRLGLIVISVRYDGRRQIGLTGALIRAFDQGLADDDGLTNCLVGPHAPANLSLADFADHAGPVHLIRRILEGALRHRTAGVNILLYGPPGTGKTELAKAVAEAAGASLFAVGEVDEDGEEPTRWDRLTSLKLAQSLLADRRDTALLFDEMEDLIGAVRVARNGAYYAKRDGSKVFINRLFETNQVPTLWTSNAIENVDPAHLRRMSYVLKMGMPSATTRKRIIDRIARTEGLPITETTIDRLTNMAPEAVTVARTAIQTAYLAGGDEEEALKVAAALVCGVRHGRRISSSRVEPPELDLNLYHSSTPIDDLVGRLSRPNAPLDFSLLLMGPPGTGKTALAHYLAQKLDRPLEIKRVSDLLSKWIGETEQQIADAFTQAAESGHVLLFDEIDSLLYDRATTLRSWEVSQVNELLIAMDHHPMPFIAATNHATKLDPAAMRRFVFKVELEPLTTAKLTHAFRRFFGAEPPVSLKEIDGLTPGDFAVVARQLRFNDEAASSHEIVELLSAEASAKPCRMSSIGFHNTNR